MGIVISQAYYRPAQRPARGLPFGVRSAGRYKARPPFSATRKKLACAQIFWCVTGSGFIDLHGKPHRLARNQLAVCLPGMMHDWRTDHGVWDFYWLTLDGPLVLPIITAFGLTAAIYNASVPPAEKFHDLMFRIRRHDKQAELDAGIMAYEILTRAAGSHHCATDSLVETAVQTLHHNYTQSSLNIKQLAAELNTTPTNLCVRFTKIMGVPPSEYLQRLRMEQALALLGFTSHPVKEIARQCGYADANYFSRLIHRITGHPPAKLRLQLRDEKQYHSGKIS